jgi:S-adenosylmethionine-dependent methyltransferase
MPHDFQVKTATHNLAQMIEMELLYRRHPSFAGLGRYLHWLCRPNVPTC